MVSHIKGIAPLSFLFLLLLFPSCHVVRYVWWNFADVTDYKKFPADTVSASQTPHLFTRNLLQRPVLVPKQFRGNDSSNLDQFLSSHKTLAFIILRKDTLVLEKYFRGYGKNSVIPSFSVSKSVVSALVGIAISKGAIRDVNQAVTDYLPDMKDPRFHEVTLADLLTMRSGIKFNEGYKNPFGEAAKFYYGLNLKRYTRKLKVVREPGSYYEYESGNAQILGMVLEKATGKSLAAYFGEKIWEPMGAAHSATWSLDSKKHREAKAFCCINATPEDFALFGQLYLNKGIIDGREVVPRGWIDQTLSLKNDSRDSQGYPYTYLWRVMDDGSYFAKGILGQFIFVCPKKQIVIVRMGESAGTLDWPEFFRLLTDQL